MICNMVSSTNFGIPFLLQVFLLRLPVPSLPLVPLHVHYIFYSCLRMLGYSVLFYSCFSLYFSLESFFKLTSYFLDCVLTIGEPVKGILWWCF